MRIGTIATAVAVCLITPCTDAVGSAVGEVNYRLVDRIAGRDGGWDFATVDPVNGRLYIARTDAIKRVDLATRNVTDALVQGWRVPRPPRTLERPRRRPRSGPTEIVRRPTRTWPSSARLRGVEPCAVGFQPAMDEGGFILDYKAQSGAAISDTDRLLRQIEQIIAATPEVASYSRRTGVQLGGRLTEADEGDYFILLKGGSRRSIDDVMADIRQQVAAKVPGLEIETAQLMEDLIGDLTAVPQPIEVKLFGDDPKVLTDAAKRVGDPLVNGLLEAG